MENETLGHGENHRGEAHRHHEGDHGGKLPKRLIPCFLHRGNASTYGVAKALGHGFSAHGVDIAVQPFPWTTGNATIDSLISNAAKVANVGNLAGQPLYTLKYPDAYDSRITVVVYFALLDTKNVVCCPDTGDIEILIVT